ncbi:MAG: LamG-like jellyroll fold domain-containing protein [Candidatus Kariarchaeaceae archaeon]
MAGLSILTVLFFLAVNVGYGWYESYDLTSDQSETACELTGSGTGDCDTSNYFECMIDNDTSTYLYENSGNCNHQFNLEDPSAKSGDIIAVGAHAICRVTNSMSGGYINIGVRAYDSDGEDYVTGTGTFTSGVDTSFVEISWYSTTNPARDAGDSWEWSDLALTRGYIELDKPTVGNVECHEFWLTIQKSPAIIKRTGEDYTDLYDAIESLGGKYNNGEKLQGDAQLLVYPYEYREPDGAPGSLLNFELNGFTLRISGYSPFYWPVSSTVDTGAWFNLDFTDSTPLMEFSMNTGGDSGLVIIEGLGFDASGWTTAYPTGLIRWKSVSANTSLILRDNVFLGQDSFSAIHVDNGPADGMVHIYNNFINNWEYGIEFSVAVDNNNSIIAHNTIYDCASGGIQGASNSSSFKAYNNVVDATAAADADFKDVGDAIGYNNVCDDNSCHRNEWESPGSATNRGTIEPNADFDDEVGGNDLTKYSGGGSVDNDCPSGDTYCDYVNEDNGTGGNSTQGGYLGNTTGNYKKNCFDFGTISPTADTHIQYIKVTSQITSGDATGDIKTCVHDASHNESCVETVNRASCAWGWDCWQAHDHYDSPDGDAWTWDELATTKICLETKDSIYTTWVKAEVYSIADDGNLIGKTISFTDEANDELFIDSGDTDLVDKGTDVIEAELNPLARYEFEDGYMTTDTTVNSNSLTCSGACSDYFNAIQNYGASYFDGTDDYYYRNQLVASTPADFTVCFWVYPLRTGQNETILGELSDESDGGDNDRTCWNISRGAADKINFCTWYDSGAVMWYECNTAPDVSARYKWHHVCASWDESEDRSHIKIFDADAGKYIGEDDSGDIMYADHSNGMYNATTDPLFMIGGNYDSGGSLENDFYGGIDDVYVFDSVLTNEQMELVRGLTHSALRIGRPGGENTANGMSANPDVGAFEYVTPRDYYIRNGGNNLSDGKTSVNAWSNFNNLDYRTFNPKDDVFLAYKDSWDDDLIFRAIGTGTIASGDYVEIDAYDYDGTGNNPRTTSTSGNYSPYVVAYKLDWGSFDSYQMQGNSFVFQSSKNLYLHDFNSSFTRISGTFENSVECSYLGYYNCGGGVGMTLWNVRDSVMDDLTIEWSDAAGIAMYERAYNVDVYDYDTDGSTAEVKYVNMVGVSPLGVGIRHRPWGGNDPSYMLYDGLTLVNTGHIGMDCCPNTEIKNSEVRDTADGYSSMGAWVVNGTGYGNFASGSGSDCGVSNCTQDASTHIDDSPHQTALQDGNYLKLYQWDPVNGHTDKWYVQGATSGAEGYVHTYHSPYHYNANHPDSFFQSQSNLSIIPNTIITSSCAYPDATSSVLDATTYVNFCDYSSQINNGDFVHNLTTGAIAEISGETLSCPGTDNHLNLDEDIFTSGADCGEYFEIIDAFDPNENICLCEHDSAEDASCDSPDCVTNYWDGTGTERYYAYSAGWGGGGIDLKDSSDSAVTYNLVGWTRRAPDQADAFGINVDDNTSDALVAFNLISNNAGGGIHINTYETGTEIYNNVTFSNTRDSNYAGGLYISAWEDGHKNATMTIKNNIFVDDGRYSIVADKYANDSNITMDYNLCWKSQSSDEVIDWKYTNNKLAATSDADSSGTALEDDDGNFVARVPDITTDDYVCLDSTGVCSKISAVTDADTLTLNESIMSGAQAYRIGGRKFTAAEVDSDTCSGSCDWYDEFGHGQNSIGDDPKVVGLEGIAADRGKIYAGGAGIDAGTDLSTPLSCTGGSDCYDYFGNVIPYNGDGIGGAEWDIGIFELQTVGALPIIYQLYQKRRVDDAELF